MNQEELIKLSDEELNELSAVKVMGKLYQNGKLWEKAENKVGHRLIKEWNPTNDMNDAEELKVIMLSQPGHLATKYIDTLLVVLGIDVNETNEYISIEKLLSASPRDITIASILAKESE